MSESYTTPEEHTISLVSWLVRRNRTIDPSSQSANGDGHRLSRQEQQRLKLGDWLFASGYIRDAIARTKKLEDDTRNARVTPEYTSTRVLTDSDRYHMHTYTQAQGTIPKSAEAAQLEVLLPETKVDANLKHQIGFFIPSGLRMPRDGYDSIGVELIENVNEYGKGKKSKHSIEKSESILAQHALLAELGRAAYIKARDM